MMPEIYLRMDSAEDCGYLTAFCNALDYAELKKGKKKLMSAPFCIITARDHVTGVMYVLVSNTFYNRALKIRTPDTSTLILKLKIHKIMFVQAHLLLEDSMAMASLNLVKPEHHH